MIGWQRKILRFFGNRGYTCDACEKEIFDYPAHRLCADCENALYKNDSFVCDKCGRKSTTAGVCLGCKSNLPAFTRGCSPFVYEGIAASLINRLKNGKRRLAFLFGEAMAAYFVHTLKTREDWGRYALNDENFLVVPVPSTPKKARERGYNQAEELALSFTESLVAAGVSARLDAQIMQARRETALQKKLGYRARQENVEGAYRVAKRAACKDKIILLIDDIMTTGATGSACAKLLTGAGAKYVFFISAVALPERKR